jgi:hypothetical protein
MQLKNDVRIQDKTVRSKGKSSKKSGKKIMREAKRTHQMHNVSGKKSMCKTKFFVTND